MNTLDAYQRAADASLDAAFNAYSPSPLDPSAVAWAVGREAEHRAREGAKLAEQPEPTGVKIPGVLGCWINGELRFQSRDHDAIHDYAERHMRGSKNFGNNVWVTPVGSFVDAKTASQGDVKKVRKVAKANG